MDVISALSIIGFVIVLGFVGRIIFDKTGIPSIIWLLLFGLVLGQALDEVLLDTLTDAAPLFSAIALIMILFNSGINMDFYKVLTEFKSAFVLAITGFVVSMFVVGFASSLIFHWDIIHGLLLGAIVGGTSSLIVIPLVEKAKIGENLKMLLSLESTLTDVFCIVVALALIQVIAGGAQGDTPYGFGHKLFATFSVGAVVGSLFAIIWTQVSRIIKTKKWQFTNMLDLAILMLLYAGVESVYVGGAGAGAIAVLFFAIIMGNGVTISRMLKLHRRYEIDDAGRMFQAELTFFTTTFFFVFLGMMFRFSSTDVLLYGMALGAVLYLMRILIVRLGIVKGKIPDPVDQKVMAVMAPRGLAAAVLAASIPAGAVLKYPLIGLFPSIIFVVIFTTIALSVISMTFICRGGKCQVKTSDKSQEKTNNKTKKQEISQ